MAEYGEVVLADGRILPEVAVVVGLTINALHGIYTTGDQDLIGIEIASGRQHLVVTCWGDEFSIRSALPEDLRWTTYRR